MREVTRSSVGAPYWDDKPVVIVGGGPSLCGFDFKRLREIDCHILTVNGSMFDIDFADAGFGLDAWGFRDWVKAFAKVPYPIYYAIDDLRIAIYHNISIIPPNIVFIGRLNSDDAKITLSEDPAAIECGGSSGFGALGVALHKRSRFVLLLGYDYAPTSKGRWHHNDRHYRPRPRALGNWKCWARNFSKCLPVLARHGVRVLNASPRSLITAFERCSVEDGMTELRRQSHDRTYAIRQSATIVAGQLV